MPFARCQDLPYVHNGRGNQRLRELLEAARTRVVRAAVIGTSMWTCPSGNGVVSFPTLCHAFNRVYGGTPETPFMAHGSYGASTPPGQYCMRGAYAAPKGSASDLAASFYPPNTDVTATDMLSEATTQGAQHLLQHDALSVHPGSSANGARCFNTATGTIVCRNLVEGFPGSATGIRWRHMTTNTIAAGYFAGHTQRNIFTATDATLDTTNSGGGRIYKILQSPTLGLSGDRYMECAAYGPNASGAKLRSLLQSFKDTSFNAGFALDTHSFGGARLANWWDSNEGTYYGNCGPVLKALNYEMVFIFMGANEALSMDSDQWFVSLNNFITWWRTNVTSLDNVHLSPWGQRLQADAYASLLFDGSGFKVSDVDVAVPTSNTIPTRVLFNSARRLFAVNTGTGRAILDIPSSGLGKIPLESGQALTIVHPQGNIMSGYADVLCPGNPSNVRLIEDTSVSG